MKVTRTLRYGGYASLVIAAVIVFVAGVNLLVDRIPWRADLTFEHFYTLSDQTEKVLGALTSPVTVLELWEAGKEDAKTLDLLQKYQARTGQLEIRQVDPYRNPVQLRKYDADLKRLAAQIAAANKPNTLGYLVFDAGGRFKVLAVADMYVWTQDPSTGETVATGYAAEASITNAISAVTSEKDPVLYVMRGHGEKELPASIAARLSNAFYVTRDLVLAQAGAVPEDADMVLGVSPQHDWLPQEAAAMAEFLRARGGKAFLLADVGTEAMPFVNSFLEIFGVAVHPWLVVERASEHMIPNQPFTLIPTVAVHEVTAANAASDTPVLFPVSGVIEKLSAVRRTVTVSPLLVSSTRAFAKKKLTTGEREAGDPDGPFVLAAAVADSGEVGEMANRLVVAASSRWLFTESLGLGRMEENETLFMSALAWLRDRPELISIPARTIAGTRYEANLSQAQFYLFGAIAVILIPVAVFVAGLVTWLRRRHR